MIPASGCNRATSRRTTPRSGRRGQLRLRPLTDDLPFTGQTISAAPSKQQCDSPEPRTPRSCRHSSPACPGTSRSAPNYRPPAQKACHCSRRSNQRASWPRNRCGLPRGPRTGSSSPSRRPANRTRRRRPPMAPATRPAEIRSSHPHRRPPANPSRQAQRLFLSRGVAQAAGVMLTKSLRRPPDS
jgi:hypothetical protein